MNKGVNLEHFLVRYARSKRKGKTKILNELCDFYGYNRKYLLQVFNHLTGKKHTRRGANRIYDGKELLEPLTRIWLATDQLCGKRLKAAIALWLPSYEDSYGMLAADIKYKLLKISPATIDRLLKSNKVRYKKRGLCGTRPGYLLKNQIPYPLQNSG